MDDNGNGADRETVYDTSSAQSVRTRSNQQTVVAVDRWRWERSVVAERRMLTAALTNTTSERFR